MKQRQNRNPKSLRNWKKEEIYLPRVWMGGRCYDKILNLSLR